MRVFGTVRPGLADALTIGNALFGAVAIGVVVVAPGPADASDATETLRIVALLVLAGVVLDVCDGAVARAVGGTALGPHLDSLADVVTFGLAPAVAIGGLAIRHSAAWEAALVAVAALSYVAAALVRLADFDAGRSRDPFYTGMPSPLAAVTALSIGVLGAPVWVVAAGLTVVAWMMVSRIRFPHSRGVGLVAEAVGLAFAVVGLVGLIDVRIPAVIAIAGCAVVAPVTFAVIRRRRPDAVMPGSLEQAEP